jgi:hypothetical protein
MNGETVQTMVEKYHLENQEVFAIIPRPRGAQTENLCIYTEP